MRHKFYYLFLILSSICKAQTTLKKHGIGLEIFGKSDIYSLNYQYTIKQNLTLRAGIGYQPGTFQVFSKNDRSFFYVPIELNKQFLKANHQINLSFAWLCNLTLYHPNYIHLKINPKAGIGYHLIIKNTLLIRTDININLPYHLAGTVNEIYYYNTQKILFWPGVYVCKLF